MGETDRQEVDPLAPPNKDPLVAFNTRLPLSIVQAIDERIEDSKKKGIDETKTEILRVALRKELGMDKPNKKAKAAKTK